MTGAVNGQIDRLSPVKREAYRHREGSGPVGLALGASRGRGLGCYLPLLRALPPGLPVVGFAADTAEVDAPLGDRIAALDRRYLAALRAPGQLARDWRFAGWSFGGTVAYEMARLAGPESAVVTLDTDRPAEPDGTTELRESTVQRFLVDDLARASGMLAPGATALRGTASRNCRVRQAWTSGSPSPNWPGGTRCTRPTPRALAAVRPTRYAGRVTLVRPGRRPASRSTGSGIARPCGCGTYRTPITSRCRHTRTPRRPRYA